MSRRKSRRGPARRRSARTRTGHSTSGGNTIGRSLHPRHLRLEPLEERRLLAVITVDTIDDTVDLNDGVTSLREAIFAANTVPGADTIEFAPELTAEGPVTILLTQGELKVTDSLTINGPDAELLTIDASGSDPTPELKNGDGSRAILISNGDLDSTIEVSISGLRITGGDLPAEGGGIHIIGEDVTLDDVRVFDNHGSGVVQYHGSLTVNSSWFDSNIGGGLYLDGKSLVIRSSTFEEHSGGSEDTGLERGRGVTFNAIGHGPDAHVEVTDSRFIKNHSDSFGGGIYIHTAGGNAIVNHNLFQGNSAGFGGGMYISSSFGEVIGNDFLNNSAIANGGGAAGTFPIGGFAENEFIENTARSGGGIYVNNSLTISSSTFRGNRAIGLSSSGGAVNASSDVTIADSTIYGNRADGNGGGISSITGRITVLRTIVEENSASRGGGIEASVLRNRSFVLRESVIRNNHASVSGGGVYTFGADVQVDSSVVTKNTSQGDGGGIYAMSSVVQISGSSITLNSAEGSGGGLLGGTTIVSGSTFAHNQAGISGGGVHGGRIIVSDSTFSTNFAGANGGAIWDRGQTDLTRSTITANSAGGYGGGLYSGVLVLESTIVASNSAEEDGVDSWQFGPFMATMYATDSLIGNGDGSMLAEAPVGLPDADGNLVGGPMHGVIDPKLGPLADNDGFELPDGSHILTHALLPGSPAINAGDLNAKAGEEDVPEFDQRGEPFARIVGGRIDIGAFEYQTPTDLNLLVDTLDDESDGDYSRGDLSLREAIELANANNYEGVVDTVRFDPALTAAGPATIQLTLGALLVTDAVHIDGPSAASLTIEASGNDPTPDEDNGDGTQVFIVGDLIEDSFIDVSISGLTMRGGDASYGGGILNSEYLTITGSRITDNASQTLGGGVFSVGGSLTLVESEITQNRAASDGGGVANLYGDLLVTKSTISGNTATIGGGIYSYGSATIEQSRIQRNSAAPSFGVGGGIFGVAGPLVVRKSQVSGNSAVDAAGIYSGTSLELVESTVSGNTASRDGGGVVGRYLTSVERSNLVNNEAGRDGGGLWLIDDATIDASTIARNTASRDGGGAWIEAINSDVEFSQVTVSGNRTGENGGGIWASNRNGTIDIAHSTIAFNETTDSGFGGGVFVLQGDLSLNHTIVATNIASAAPDLTGLVGATITAQYSLIGDNHLSGFAEARFGQPDANGNLIGGPAFGPIDPRLGTLAYNGGPTPTHALTSNFSALRSPAIDAGVPNAIAGENGIPQYDQRGMPYDRVVDRVFPSQTNIDIGAYERQQSEPVTVVIGDYNRNGRVDAADYTVWRDKLGSAVEPYTTGDGNGDGEVDWADYDVWKWNFGRDHFSSGAGSIASHGAESEADEPEASLVSPAADAPAARGTGSIATPRAELIDQPLPRTSVAGGSHFELEHSTITQRDSLLAWWSGLRPLPSVRSSEDIGIGGKRDGSQAVDAVFATFSEQLPHLE